MAKDSGTHDPTEAVDLWKGIREYLTVDVHVDAPTSPEPASVVKIKVSIKNTAPAGPDWPEVAFMGVGLEVHPNGNRRARDSLKAMVIGEGASSPPLKAVGGYDSVLPETKDGSLLESGQTIVYEFECPFRELPALEFRAEGTLSYHRFFRFLNSPRLPASYLRPTVLPFVRDFNKLDVHHALDVASDSVGRLGPGSTLAQVQAVNADLSTGIEEAEETQRSLANVKPVTSASENPFNQHLKMAHGYLRQVGESCLAMKHTFSSADPDEIAAAKSAILELKNEAASIDRATEATMTRYGISDEEAGYRNRTR